MSLSTLATANPTDPSHDRVLILGATGGFGRAMLDCLLQRGYSVRILVRNRALATLSGPRGLTPHEQLDVLEGNALDQDDLFRASEGCQTIIHAVNVPYHRWSRTMPDVTSRVIAAACLVQARVVFPGNVYPLGLQVEAPLGEDAPLRPNTVKGQLRYDLEAMLRLASDQQHIRVILIRSGDFFGPSVRNGLVDPIFRNALQGKPLRLLGLPEAPHQWAYVPDVARLTADLMALPSHRMTPMEVVHHAGDLFLPQTEFHDAISRCAGHPGLPIHPVSWRFLHWLGYIHPHVRELMELSYLFDAAVILDDPRRRELLPDFRTTPRIEALETTLASYRQG